MIFTQSVFFSFVGIFFLLYFATLRWKGLNNLITVVGSYIFYGWWDYRFTGLLLISSLVDFYVGEAIGRTDSPSKRKRLLYLSITTNLGILGFFKYYGFFVESAVSTLGIVGIEIHPPLLSVLLPVGISFYTFQSMSYTIDIYRGKMQPCKSLLSFLAYVSFFPQLVAGPIERAKHLLPQIDSRRRFDFEQASDGMRQILAGLFKKVVLADNLATIVDLVYAQPESYGPFALFVATWAFGLQIYFDFSGYSDIAIGLGRIMGVDICQNFRTPYFAPTLRDFWRRWHISLSSFFRDYVYIPLDGGRASKARVIRNLFIAFTLSGLWHGAEWTFVLWGIYHFVGLVVQSIGGSAPRVCKGAFRILSRPVPAFFITQVFVTMGWVFFRAESAGDAFSIFRAFITPSAYLLSNLAPIGASWQVLIGTVAFLCLEFLQREKPHVLTMGERPRLFRFCVLLCTLLGIIFWGNGGQSGFIYFRF